MPAKEELRALVRDNLRDIVLQVNATLKGEGLDRIGSTLERVGRDGRLPHWFEQLSREGTLPNLDGKTIGSVIEMLLVGVLEAETFAGVDIPALRMNPARGVDLPDLDLGVKSPSENFCTSEPFYSAYERLYGSEYDVVVLLTDYQTAKINPPLRLQLIGYDYLTGSQLADRALCGIAKKHRDRLLEESEPRAKRVFRFLGFVNQSDWLGSKLLGVVNRMDSEAQVGKFVAAAKLDFAKKNRERLKKSRSPLVDADLEALLGIPDATPLSVGVVDALDNWVADNLKEASRIPNDNEWARLKTGPLDGRIGISFALQWRYNFGQLFRASDEGRAAQRP